MTAFACDWCDSLFNFTPPKGTMVKPYSKIFCSEKCRNLEKQFIRMTNEINPKWRCEDDQLS